MIARLTDGPPERAAASLGSRPCLARGDDDRDDGAHSGPPSSNAAFTRSPEPVSQAMNSSTRQAVATCCLMRAGCCIRRSFSGDARSGMDRVDTLSCGSFFCFRPGWSGSQSFLAARVAGGRIPPLSLSGRRPGQTDRALTKQARLRQVHDKRPPVQPGNATAMPVLAFGSRGDVRHTVPSVRVWIERDGGRARGRCWLCRVGDVSAPSSAAPLLVAAPRRLDATI